MNKAYTLGKYEYSSATIKLAAGFFVAGFLYALLTKKSALSIFAFAMVGSVAGFSVGAIIHPPKRVIE